MGVPALQRIKDEPKTCTSETNHVESRPRVIRTSAGAQRAPAGSGARRGGEDDRAGADHGRAACRPSRSGARRNAAPIASSSRSSSIRRSSRRTRTSAPIRGRSPPIVAALAALKADLGLGAVGRDHVSGRLCHPRSCRKARPWPAWKMRSGRIFSPAWRPWSASFSSNASRTSRCSARRITSSSRSSRRLARDLDLKTRIVGVPTVREPDGLALSSRNALFVAGRARRGAGALSRAQRLRRADRRRRADRGRRSTTAATAITQARASRSIIWKRANAETLAPLASRKDGPIRLLVAARIGKTRLIDNIAA